MDNTVGSLTKLQRSVIIGTLLGDGYLRIVSGRANAFLEINHSITQKEYVDWKYEMLKSVCKSGPIQRKGNGKRIAYRFTTRQSEEFTSLYQTFYQSGKKIIPEILEIDPISLAVWFMDDGSKCRESDVYLNTQQFDVDDQKKLISFMRKWGIESTLNRDKIYWRIRIKKSSIKTFFKIISPYIIPSMNYKIGYNPVETCIEEQFLHAELLPREAVNTPTPF
jgi:hypothetical protein